MKNATIVVLVALAPLFGAACDDELSSEECRLDPANCAGGAGGFCDVDDDCAPELHCCRDNGNCGGGMCTASCRVHEDCPADMLCKHDLCFYACDSDADCARGMSCEHDRTVCEWD